MTSARLRRIARLVALAALVTTVAGCSHGSRAALQDAGGPTPRADHATLGGLKIAYVIHNAAAKDTAAPIVYVHGWSCNRSAWDDVINGGVRNGGEPNSGSSELGTPESRLGALPSLPASLARRTRIALDLPGHGESDAPAHAESITLNLFADAVAAVLDREHIRAAILVGHSNGVPVIRQFYRRSPKRVVALVAVDGPFKSFFRDAAAAQPFLEQLKGDQSDAFMTTMVTSMLASAPPERRERVLAMMLATPPEVRVAAFRAVLDPVAWKDDPITVPLMLVNARQPAWDAEYLAYVRTLAPGMTYHEMTGASHFLMMDEPAHFNGLLADFLDANGL